MCLIKVHASILKILSLTKHFGYCETWWKKTVMFLCVSSRSLFFLQDYFEIVKNPMDLSTIKRKLDTGLSCFCHVKKWICWNTVAVFPLQFLAKFKQVKLRFADFYSMVWSTWTVIVVKSHHVRFTSHLCSRLSALKSGSCIFLLQSFKKIPSSPPFKHGTHVFTWSKLVTRRCSWHPLM